MSPVGPTIWADGRIVGGWAQRPTGAIVVRLLEDVGREATTAIEEAADRLQAWIDQVVAGVVGRVSRIDLLDERAGAVATFRWTPFLTGD